MNRIRARRRRLRVSALSAMGQPVLPAPPRQRPTCRAAPGSTASTTKVVTRDVVFVDHLSMRSPDRLSVMTRLLGTDKIPMANDRTYNWVDG